MTGSPPHIDLEDLVAARVDQSVDERVIPVVGKLNNATDKLDDITPILVRMAKRQNGQETWLIALTVVLSVLAGYVINHLS